MAVIGNHVKTNALPNQKEAVRNFYLNVLGWPLGPSPRDDTDVFVFGDGGYVGVAYKDPILTDEQQVNQGTYLEIKSSDPARLQAAIEAADIQKLSFSTDDMFFFQAPGGQVYRLVAMDF